MSFVAGDVARLSGKWTVSNTGTAIDPDTVTLKVKHPDGSVSTYTYPATLMRASAGNYYCDVPLPASGRWYYRFESTGNGQAAKEKSITVQVSRF